MSEPSTWHNGQLQSIVERIENVNEEIKGLTEGRSEIFAEAKSNGYDVKVLRKVIALRRMDPDARAEQESVMEAYIHALGMT